MAVLSSRLVITLQDNASGPAARIRQSLVALKGTIDQARATPYRVMATQAKEMHNQLRGAATTSAYALAGLVAATREYNEAEYGYTFARVPDHMRGIKLDLGGLKTETQAVSQEARATARSLGMIPEQVMKARTEVQKIGIEGDAGQSLWMAALGLNLSDSKMPTDLAAKYLGAMYRSFAKQRAAMAADMGVDMQDPAQARWFEEFWVKSISAKSAFAAAKSALDPSDLVSGARQYAPQWAQFGMTPDQVLGAIAHGSNFGFMAPELGTALKSMASRLIKPTNAGTRWMNALGIDRSQFMDFSGADPTKATNQLHSLLGGSLGKKQKHTVLQMLMDAQKQGTTATPEFQETLTQTVGKMLGRRTEQDLQEIQNAIFDATLTSGGTVDVIGFIKEAKAKGATPAALLEILEGRHFARNSPFFQFFEQFTGMIGDLQKIDATHLDAVVQARKDSSAGSTTALLGAFQDLLITAEKSGVIEGLKNALLGLGDAIAGFEMANPGGVKVVTQALAGLAGLAVVGMVLGGIARGMMAVKAAAVGLIAAAVAVKRFTFAWTGLGAGLGVAGGLAGALAGRALGGAGAPVGPSILNPLAGTAAGAAAGGAAAGAGSRILGGLGAMARRGAGMLVPGLGLVLLGSSLYGAYDAYQKTGTWSGAALGFLGLGPAKADEAQPGQSPAQTMVAAGQHVAATGAAQPPPTMQPGLSDAGPLAETRVDAASAVSAVQSAATQIHTIIGGVDLTAEGQRIAESLAAGIRNGTGAIESAAAAAGDAARNAVRSSLSDAGFN